MLESKIYYRRNNNNKAQYWQCIIENNRVYCKYGLIGGTQHNESYAITKKSVATELNSRINDKVKNGYITLEEVVDESGNYPVEDINSPILAAYLERYLPYNLTNGNNNTLLPMLAKAYSGNVWKKCPEMIGQYKINGLRCLITASVNEGDMFKPIKLTFQSREGIIWNSLGNLEDYLLATLDRNLLKNLIDNGWALDGELYLPGYDINHINSFVKNTINPENKLLQFWCYDIAMDNMSQHCRDDFRFANVGKATKFNNIKDHLNNTDRLIVLDNFVVTRDEEAFRYRNKFVNLGFEGLILRNPDAEYQYNRRRAGFMEKFKYPKEGDFKIVNIYKENKRELPILLCRNDINDHTFETRLSCPFDVQAEVLHNRILYVGKYVHINFGERSGIKRVPFHIKNVEFAK